MVLGVCVGYTVSEFRTDHRFASTVVVPAADCDGWMIPSGKGDNGSLLPSHFFLRLLLLLLLLEKRDFHLSGKSK